MGYYEVRGVSDGQRPFVKKNLGFGRWLFLKSLQLWHLPEGLQRNFVREKVVLIVLLNINLPLITHWTSWSIGRFPFFLWHLLAGLLRNSQIIFRVYVDQQICMQNFSLIEVKTAREAYRTFILSLSSQYNYSFILKFQHAKTQITLAIFLWWVFHICKVSVGPLWENEEDLEFRDNRGLQLHRLEKNLTISRASTTLIPVDHRCSQSDPNHKPHD